MTNWSPQRIKETLEFWQPKYDQLGVKLTEEDAREILDNLTGFFNTLAEIDRRQKKEAVELDSESQKPIESGKTNEDKLVSVAELAKILNVPASWIYQRTRLGQEGIPHMKMGKYIRFNPIEVISFFKSQKTESGN